MLSYFSGIEMKIKEENSIKPTVVLSTKSTQTQNNNNKNEPSSPISNNTAEKAADPINISTDLKISNGPSNQNDQT